MEQAGRTCNAEPPAAVSNPDLTRGSKSVSCLVLHGLGGGLYELEPLIVALRGAGLRVEAPVLPGHEGPGPVMPASCWEDWAAAVERAYDGLCRGGGPVAVIGFSTGGTLALDLASRRAVARQVLMAPFLAIRYTRFVPLRPASYLRHLARLIPDLPRRPPAVRDPVMRAWAAGNDRFRTFNLNAACSALELIDRVKPLVPSIPTPTLILQGRLDTVVEPDNAAWLYRNLGAADKRLVMLDRTDHLVVLDYERADVIRTTLEFVLEREPRTGQPGHEAT